MYIGEGVTYQLCPNYYSYNTMKLYYWKRKKNLLGKVILHLKVIKF